MPKVTISAIKPSLFPTLWKCVHTMAGMKEKCKKKLGIGPSKAFVTIVEKLIKSYTGARQFMIPISLLIIS